MDVQANGAWRDAGQVMCLCLVTLPVCAQEGKRIFVSPRHSQVSMTGAWEPELLREGKGQPRYHWISSTKGDVLSLRFEGTSVALATRTGVRISWWHPTHTNSLARLGRLDVRLDGKPLPSIDLSGSTGVPAYELPIVSGLGEGPHVLELSNAGVGAVDVAGFMLDRPQKGSEPDFSRESPELVALTRTLPPIMYIEGAPRITREGSVVLRAEGGIENLPSLLLDNALSGQGYRLVQSADGKEVRLCNLRGMMLIFR